jgi:hypothetical protein
MRTIFVWLIIWGAVCGVRAQPPQIFNNVQDDPLSPLPAGLPAQPAPHGVLETPYFDDPLDSALCQREDGDVKESFTYNDHGFMLLHLKQRRSDNGWANEWRKTLSYDDQDQLLLRTEEQWDGENMKWQGDRRYHYTYDDQGNRLSRMYETWYENQATWRKHWRESWTYNDHNFKITELHENWDYNLNAWRSDFRYLYTYDDQDRLLVMVEEKYGGDPSSWYKFRRFTYHYDAHGNNTGYLQENWNSNTQTWENSWRATWGYNDDDVWDFSLYESWDDDTGTWVNELRETRTIDDQGQWRGSVFEYWDEDEGCWIYSGRAEFTYTSFGSMLSGFGESWDKQNSCWVNSWRFQYEYDQRENLVHAVSENWIDSTWQVIEGSVVFSHFGYFYCFTGLDVRIFYSSTTDVEGAPTHVPERLVLKQNYPNPFNSTTVISYTLDRPQTVTLTIYDLQGRKIRTLVNKKQPAGMHAILWDGNNEQGKAVGTGWYWYRIRTGSNSAVRKMLLIK